MPKKIAREQLVQMCEELIRLKGLVDWYETLKDQVKAGMQQHKLELVELPALGQVKASASPRWTVPPEAVREILPELAEKLIEVKYSVPNERLKALVEIGVISADQREDLYKKSKVDTQVSLYVQPQK